MKRQPKVSIIMNCYNCSKFLKEAIDSVYLQTFNDWEIIFWDNASTDSSARIALSYDSRIKYYRAEKTTNLGLARVLAVKKSTGAYLAFLDCDDLWLKNKLKDQMDIFNQERDDIGIVYGRASRFLGNNKNRVMPGFFAKSTKLPEGLVFNELVKGDFIPFVSAVIPRIVYDECGGFPVHYKNATDYSLFLKISYHYPVRAIQDVCCMYRMHENNLSGVLELDGIWENIEAIQEFPVSKITKIGLSHQYLTLSIYYYKNGKYLSFLKVLFFKHIFLLIVKRFYDRVERMLSFFINNSKTP